MIAQIAPEASRGHNPTYFYRSRCRSACQWRFHVHCGSWTITSRFVSAGPGSRTPRRPRSFTRPGQCEPSPTAVMRLVGIPFETRTDSTALARASDNRSLSLLPPSLEVLPISVMCSPPCISVLANRLNVSCAPEGSRNVAVPTVNPTEPASSSLMVPQLLKVGVVGGLTIPTGGRPAISAAVLGNVSAVTQPPAALTIASHWLRTLLCCGPLSV